MWLHLRVAAVVMVGVSTVLLGMWIGEDASSPTLPLIKGTFSFVAAGLLAFAVLRGIRLRRRIVVGLAICGVGAAAFVLGDREASAAFNECVDRGEEV